jgi:hypothetical protein
MRPTVYLALVPLLGCNTDTGGDDSLFADPHAYADLYTDGSRLDVVGCPTSAILGCSPYAPSTADRMRVTIDGTQVPVPVATTDLPSTIDSIMGLFHDGPFGVTTTAPADGRVVVAINAAGATVTLPTPPPLAVAMHASRTGGAVTVRHDVLAGQTDLLVIVNTTCAGVGGGEFGDNEVTLGEYALDLTRSVPAGATTCTHEVHVDQLVELAALPDLPTRAIAISTATITSDP